MYFVVQVLPPTNMQRSPCIPVIGKQTRNTAKSYSLPGFDCGLLPLSLSIGIFFSGTLVAAQTLSAAGLLQHSPELLTYLEHWAEEMDLLGGEFRRNRGKGLTRKLQKTPNSRPAFKTFPTKWLLCVSAAASSGAAGLENGPAVCGVFALCG